MENINTDKDFLRRTSITLQLRERMDKWYYMKLKIFCTIKEIVFKLMRPPTEWKKIFVGYTSDKGLITRIIMDLKKLNFPKINELIKKCATELNRTFSKKEVEIISGHKANASQNHTKI
jgi:hypothetical protein